MAKSTNKNPYYTNDHEWIDFQGAVAYMGEQYQMNGKSKYTK